MKCEAWSRDGKTKSMQTRVRTCTCCRPIMRYMYRSLAEICPPFLHRTSRNERGGGRLYGNYLLKSTVGPLRASYASCTTPTRLVMRSAMPNICACVHFWSRELIFVAGDFHDCQVNHENNENWHHMKACTCTSLSAYILHYLIIGLHTECVVHVLHTFRLAIPTSYLTFHSTNFSTISSLNMSPVVSIALTSLLRRYRMAGNFRGIRFLRLRWLANHKEKA